MLTMNSSNVIQADIAKKKPLSFPNDKLVYCFSYSKGGIFTRFAISMKTYIPNIF